MVSRQPSVTSRSRSDPQAPLRAISGYARALHRWYYVKLDGADVIEVVSSFPVLSSRGVCTLGTGSRAFCSKANFSQVAE